MAMVSWVYADIKAQKIVYLKYRHFIVCQLYLTTTKNNKKEKKSNKQERNYVGWIKELEHKLGERRPIRRPLQKTFERL